MYTCAFPRFSATSASQQHPILAVELLPTLTALTHSSTASQVIHHMEPRKNKCVEQLTGAVVVAMLVVVLFFSCGPQATIAAATTTRQEQQCLYVSTGSTEMAILKPSSSSDPLVTTFVAGTETTGTAGRASKKL